MSLSQTIGELEGESLVRAVPGEDSRLVVLRHGDDWKVGFRLIHDRPGPWQMTEFSAVYTGDGSATAEMLRRLPLGDLLRRARRAVSRPTDDQPVQSTKLFRPSDIDAMRLAAFLVDGRGRRKRTDEDFAQLAMVYLLLVTDGDPAPAKSLSERHGGSPAVWANRISEARRRGLLTSPQPGAAGGYLTDKGEAILGYPLGHPDNEDDQ